MNRLVLIGQLLGNKIIRLIDGEAVWFSL